MKKTPKWLEMVTRFPEKVRGAKGGELCDCHVLALDAWPECKEWIDSGLTAFAYLWRRFGPSPMGYCPETSYVEYHLTTPMKNLWLTLDLRPSGLAYAVGYLATEGLLRKVNKPIVEWMAAVRSWGKANGHGRYSKIMEDKTLREKAYKACGPFPSMYPDTENWRTLQGFSHDIHQALYDTMYELRRPVWVRDVPFDILGNCETTEFQGSATDFVGAGIGVKVIEQEVK